MTDREKILGAMMKEEGISIPKIPSKREPRQTGPLIDPEEISMGKVVAEALGITVR